MSMFSRIKNLDQTFSWSFLGFILSVGFGGIGIYSTFFHEKNPRLVIQTISSTPVYSLAENVSKLDILFEGEDIRSKNQTLSLLTLRLINQGNEALVNGSFDPQLLPRLVLGNTKVIKEEIIHASSGYLQAAAKLVPEDNETYSISPIIMEPDEFFDVKFLLLHEAGSSPSVSASGKIAGMGNIETVSLVSKGTEVGFWKSSLAGNLWTQLVRVLVYFIGTILAILLLSAAYDGFSKWREKSRRKGVVNKFKLGSGLKFNNGDEQIFRAYIEKGEMFVFRLSQLISDSNFSSKLHLFHLNSVDLSGNRSSQSETAGLDYVEVEACKFLIENNLIINEDSSYRVDPEVKSNTNDFVMSLTILSPRLMRMIRSANQSYGSDTDPTGETEGHTSTSNSNQ